MQPEAASLSAEALRLPPVDFLPEEDKASVAALREAFKDEFLKRSAEGRLHPCFFGDIPLTRICRGCGHNPARSKAWFERFLKKAEETDLDELTFELSRKLDDCGLSIGDGSILPFHDEVTQYSRVTYSAPKLTPDGDMVAYTPLSDVDKHGILDGLNWDHFVKNQRSMIVLRCMDLEKLSRAQGRIAQVIMMWDMEGCTVDSLFVRNFDAFVNRDISSFASCIAAEVIARFYILNGPWALTTLWGMAKMFLPERLAQKTVFVNGNGLGDPDFVQAAGGEEQLQKLFATRLGLAAKRSRPSADETSDALPSSAEKEKIAELRGRFKEELDKREAEGRVWPCFFGDIALTRVLRGNEGHLNAAAHWLKRFLVRMEELDIDSLVREMTAKLDESSEQFGSTSMLPYADEIGQYNRFVFSAMRLTPAGDVVSYIPLSEHDRAGLVKNVVWEKFVRYALAIVILRSIELDRLSHIQQRVVRSVVIVDLEGAGLGISGLPSVPEFDLRNKVEIEPMLFDTSIDVLRKSYILNTPWIAVKAYNWVKPLVPEKIVNKLRLLEGDGHKDVAFVRAVGGEAQLQQLLAARTRSGVRSGAGEESLDVAPGLSLQRNCPLRAGQRVKWKFEVQAGTVDDWLGTSDLEFSVVALWFPQQRQEPVVQPPAPESMEKLEADEGSLEFDGLGTYVQVTDVPSFLVFTWSLWVRPAVENWSGEHIFMRRAEQTAFNVIDGTLMLWLNSGCWWETVVKASWDPAFIDVWHHLAASYDGKTATIYVNGAPVQTARSSIELATSDEPILVGAGLDYADRYFFKGQLTEVCMYSAALPAEQIRSSMKARVDPCSETELVGYAHLCRGVFFAHRGGVLLQNNVGRVHSLVYRGKGACASSRTPFTLARRPDEAQVPAARGTEAVDASNPRHDALAPAEVIVPPTMAGGRGAVSGMYESSRSGVVTFKWSNAHSRIRSKSLTYSLDVRNAVDDYDECEEGEVSAEEEEKELGTESLTASDRHVLAALHARAAQKLEEVRVQQSPQALACAVADSWVRFMAAGQLVYKLDDE